MRLRLIQMLLRINNKPWMMYLCASGILFGTFLPWEFILPAWVVLILVAFFANPIQERIDEELTYLEVQYRVQARKKGE